MHVVRSTCTCIAKLESGAKGQGDHNNPYDTYKVKNKVCKAGTAEHNFHSYVV